MRFHALATDYDGTIAHDGIVDDATIAALERLRKSGRKLVLVTGRILPELQEVCPRLDLFDLAVIENGAAVYTPATKEVRVLAEPPPPSFEEELRRRGVKPIITGHVIVASFVPHETVMFETIRDLGLELQVIFNKDAVMVLPSGVNKATGLMAALEDLGLSAHNTVGVGDAENDHAFLKLCECSAAVANALPAVKDTADVVTPGARGAGVAELIDQMLANDLSHLKTLSRHRIGIGECDGCDHTIDPAGAGLLVCGASGSGKSTLTTALLERLSDAGYQAFVIDPEGDYTSLDFVTHVGGAAHAPELADVTDALRAPRRSISVNLLGVPAAERPAFFAQLMPLIVAEKARTGRPHWLVIDEANHLLPVGRATTDAAALLPDRGLMLVTVHAGSVDPRALVNVGTVAVIGRQPGEALREYCAASGEPAPHCPPLEGDVLAAGDALLWRRGEAAAAVIHTKPPRTVRRRHLRKYAAGNLGPDRSFHFRGPEGKLNLKAPNLFQFLQLADGVDDETWEFHRRNGDYSKWAREQIKDAQLADALAAVEADARAGPKESRAAVRAAVEARYTLPVDASSGIVD